VTDERGRIEELERELADAYAKLRAVSRERAREDGPPSSATTRAARAAFQEVDEQVRAIFSASLDAMVLADDTGRWTAANDAAAELFGVPRASLIGRTPADFAPPGFDFEAAWRAFLAARALQGEFLVRRPDGTLRFADFRATADILPGRHLSVLRDVTDKKAAEHALETSARRYRLLVEASADVVYITAPDAIVYVSPAVKNVLGYAPEELVGQSTWPFLHHEDRAAVARAQAEILRCPGAKARARFRVRHKSGAYRTVQATATNLLEEPAIAGIVVNVHDVTERDEALAALEDAQAVAHVGSWTWAPPTPAGRLVASRETLRIFGFDTDERSTLAEFLAFIHPEDRARAEEVLGRAVSEPGTHEAELRIRRADGSVRWVHARVMAERDEVGRPLRVIGTTLDITERRRAEDARARLAAIVASSNDAIFSRTLDGKIVSWNRGAERLFGWAEHEIVGQSASILAPPSEHGEMTESLSRVAAGEPVECENITRLRRDGTSVAVDVRLSPIRDANGQVVGVASIVHDVTQRRRAEAAEKTLRETEQQLRQAQKLESIGQLAGGVAHDFNNILSVILGYTSLLVEDVPPNDPIHADIEEIHAAGLRATDLTRQLLAFSRNQVLQPKVLDLGVVVLRMEKMLGRLLGEHIDLALVPGADTGLVRADPGQIEQVLLNLAVNARDAMPAGGRLTIATNAVRVGPLEAGAWGIAPGRYVSLTVTDTGHGMDEATAARVFEPFFTTKEKGKGTGLGLSTVFGIVKQSNGHIRLESAPDRGARFEVLLPVTQERATKGAGSDDRAAPRGRGETVLVVEDDDQVRALARNVLRRNGYVVLEAANAGEALLIAEQGGTIDLLLTDVVMPRIGGHQLAERLRAARPTLKVLYMSGYTDDTVMRQGVELGRLAFLPKPLTSATLTRRVREMLDAQVG